ncbi:MAG: beta-ketoacyl-ACP synthase III [Hydrotalea sp.]|nr:beta-ketoacyl-ACP synthase III [Hydrotalea sp.]
MELKKTRLVGVGHYLPARVITNHDLPASLDTSDEWIFQRTGIKKRHFVADGEKCSDMAIAAATAAIKTAGVAAGDIDMVVVATSTPDDTYPATAGLVQAALGISPGPFFDVQAVCAGFTYALFLANQSIMLGAAKNILVVGADVNSKIIDATDRATYVLFGDGAGAVILHGEKDSSDKNQPGIINCKIDGDGRQRDKLFVDGGVSSTGTVGKVKMKGQDVFRYAVDKMGKIVEQCLADADLTVADIDWYIPHQANSRIMDAVCERLKMDRAKVISTVHEHANISAATIPVAMSMANDDKKFKPGQLLAMSALGGGFAWGGALLRWG